MSTAPQRHPVTIEEFLALPGDVRAELIRGTLIPKAAPSAEHAAAQSGIDRRVGHRFHRQPGGEGPGGWWLFVELDVQLGGEIFRPDVCGYRRDRRPEPPRARPVRDVPEWICEVLSPSTEALDRVEKLRSYLAAGVEHSWLLNPVEGTLEILRRTDRGYLLVQTARRGEHVRPEPFDQAEFSLDELLGGEPDDGA